jgi:hypothetical protein
MNMQSTRRSLLRLFSLAPVAAAASISLPAAAEEVAQPPRELENPELISLAQQFEIAATEIEAATAVKSAAERHFLSSVPPLPPKLLIRYESDWMSGRLTDTHIVGRGGTATRLGIFNQFRPGVGSLSNSLSK